MGQSSTHSDTQGSPQLRDDFSAWVKRHHDTELFPAQLDFAMAVLNQKSGVLPFRGRAIGKTYAAKLAREFQEGLAKRLPQTGADDE